MMRDSHKVRFRPPKDFSPPEGIQPGDTFDVVCTMKPEADGLVCLVKMGDSPMPGYDEHDQERDKPKPDYAEHVRDMQGQMGQEQPQPQGGY